MKNNILYLFVLSMIIISCKNKSEQPSDEFSGLIGVTKSQFESEKMEIGASLLKPFHEVVFFSGSIIPTTNGQAQISLPMPGVINKIYTKPGQIITKGAAIFEVSGNAFIEQQKDFAESAAILSRLKSDYLRAKELYSENITSQKELTFAESNYFAENAKFKALKIKLESIGLDVSKIEKGEFFTSYTIKSPIDGYVAKINVTIGQYLEQQQNIAEIIDVKSFQLKLAVFEKNIDKVKIGQTVSFYLNGNKEITYQAIINTVGKNIITESKSIECYAEITSPNIVNLVNNQFVEGEVYTTIDSALSVPESAVIKIENDTYLLVFEKEKNSTFYFKKTKIKTGRRANKQIELIEKIPSNKILINGAYNLQVD